MSVLCVEHRREEIGEVCTAAAVQVPLQDGMNGTVGLSYDPQTGALLSVCAGDVFTPDEAERLAFAILAQVAAARMFGGAL